MAELTESPDSNSIDRVLASSSELPTTASNLTRSKKSVACNRCHERKVKCSGGTPCSGCVSARREDECVYSSRDRRIKVSERYLQQVLAENRQLKQTSALPRPPSIRETPTTLQAIGSLHPEDHLSNPLMQDRAWFVSSDVTAPPIYIGEAACTAFATRFRQILAMPHGSAHHSPRISYVQDADLLSVTDPQVPWPSRSQAHLLLKVALARINRAFHVILTKPTVAKLDQIYQDSQPPDASVTCKFFAIFALGEVYSNRARVSAVGNFPGISYFMRACSLIQILPERANLDHIEILILLSFFSYNLNRRNSAYLWIGSALRLGLTIGLHHNIPATVAMDPVAQQHRVRIWWTIYICDRLWGSKLGHPLTIQDRDITVDLPSDSGLTGEEKTDFPDPAYIIASIKLSKIAGDIITKIYCRGNPPPFINSVQQILRELNIWMSALPESIRLCKAEPSSRYIVSLHLSFNQLVILATRPVLLHVFTTSHTLPTQEGGGQSVIMEPVTSTLAEACLRTARHSNELLTEVWIEGTLSTLGYFDAQYLFSSTVILAISSISDAGGRDSDLVESAAQLLQTMADSGNVSATEFCGHLDQVRADISHHHSATRAEPTISEPDPFRGTSNIFDTTMDPLTAEMALLDQPMQEFLTQTDFTFDFPNPVDWIQNAMHL